MELTANLWAISETEAPFVVGIARNKDFLDKEDAKPISLAKFFTSRIVEREWHTIAEKKAVARFKTLFDYLVAIDAQAYRNNNVASTIYMVVPVDNVFVVLHVLVVET